MNQNIQALLEYLRNTGTAEAKIDRIKAVMAAHPGVGAVRLVDLCDEQEVVPPGTLTKMRRWLEAPTLTAPPLVRKSTGDLLVEHATALDAPYYVTDHA